MGMGYSAAFADTVSEEIVKKLCPKEHEAFNKFLNESNVSLELFAQALRDGGSINDYLDDGDTKISAEAEETIRKLYHSLRESFTNNSDGANLVLEYHDSDNNGDRYDDINGAFWMVEDVWELTPAGKLLAGLGMKRDYYVVFG